MKKVLLICSILISASTFAQVYSGPESVEWDSVNNRWLISNTTSHAILARSVGGTLTTLVPNTTQGPYGIEILNGVVYACCSGRVKGYDLTSGAEVFNMNLSAAFLNGMTTDGDSVLYVTDFNNKDIFRINPSTNKSYVLSSNTTTTPNGIIYDGTNNRCVFIAWGSAAPIKAINLNPPYTITTLTTTTLSNCDGITRDQNGYYYVTAWSNNRLNRFRADFTGGHTVLSAFVLNSPADIDLKPGSTDTVGVPNSGNNTCTFIPLNQTIPEYTASTTTICAGDTIVYTDGSVNTTSISWDFVGGSPSSGTTSPIMVVYAAAGPYTTTLTSTNAFGTASTSSSVTVVASPTPSITAAGNDLSTTLAYTTYQWYHNGTLIPGATSQNYTVTMGGDYYCEVTSAGCLGVSNILSSTLNLENFSILSTTIYPNPVEEMLNIEFITNENISVEYSIMDLQGRMVKNSNIMEASTGMNLWTVDLSQLANGSYILQLTTVSGRMNKVFVKY